MKWGERSRRDRLGEGMTVETTQPDRLAAARRELLAASIRRFDGEPLVDRLLARLGIDLRPPHYRPFWPNVLAMGAFFGPAWGIMMWFATWRAEEMSPVAAIALSASAGLLYGLLVAGWYRRSARRNRLSRWEDLAPPDGARTSDGAGWTRP